MKENDNQEVFGFNLRYEKRTSPYNVEYFCLITNLECERNGENFRDCSSNFNGFLDLVVFNTLYLCRYKHPFRNYNLSLVSNMRSFM